MNNNNAAVVTSVKGIVSIQREDGCCQLLQKGDLVLANDVIHAVAGSLTMKTVDGEQYQVNSGQTSSLADGFILANGDSGSNKASLDEVVAQESDNKVEPSLQVELNNEGIFVVVIEFEDPTAPITSGYETSAPAIQGLPDEFKTWFYVPEEPDVPIVNVVFSIVGTELVDEGAVASYTVSYTGQLEAGQSASVVVASVNGAAEFILDFGNLMQQFANNSQVNFDPATGILTFYGTGSSATDIKSVDFNVNIVDDVIVEGPENYFVQISDPNASAGVSASIAIPEAETVINETMWPGGDPDKVIFQIEGDILVNEGSDAFYTVSYVNELKDGKTASVSIGTTDIDAQFNLDFSQLEEVVAVTPGVAFAPDPSGNSGVLTFTGGAGNATSINFKIPTINDTLVETSEDYKVVLSDASVETATIDINNDEVTTTIIDNDELVFTIFDDLSVTEGDFVLYFVSYTGDLPAGVSASVQLTPVDISATLGIDYSELDLVGLEPGIDYDSATGILTFTGSGDPGLDPKEAVFGVFIGFDTEVEGVEIFNIVLSNEHITSGANVSIDNDTVVTDINDITSQESVVFNLIGTEFIIEGGQAVYTLSFTGNYEEGAVFSVQIDTMDLTAELGLDYDILTPLFADPTVEYDSNTGTVTFTIADINNVTSSVQFAVDTFTDPFDEGLENYNVSLSNPEMTDSIGLIGDASIDNGEVITNIIDVPLEVEPTYADVWELAIGPSTPDPFHDGTDPNLDGEFFSGSIYLDFGPSGPAAVDPFVFSNSVSAFDPDDGYVPVLLTSDGDIISFVTDNGGQTLLGIVDPFGTGDYAGETVISIDLIDINTGEFLVSLYGPVDHPDINEIYADDYITFGVNYTYTAQSGDSVTGPPIFVSIVDDGPIAGTPEIENVEERKTVTGNVLSDESFGADGPADIPVQSFSHNGFEYTEDTPLGANSDILSVSGTTITIMTELDGIFEFDFATGDYTYTAGSDSGGLNERIDYTFVDNDGDTSDSYLDIFITEDEEPIIGAPAEVSVDEAALSIGSNPVSTAEIVTDVLDYDFGGDGPAAVTPFSWSPIVTIIDTDDLGPVSLTSDGEAIIFEVLDGGETLLGKTVGGKDIIRITLDDINTGEFTTELLGQVDHPDLDEVGLLDQLTLNLSYTIEDSDGSTATGIVKVNILDDGPTTETFDKAYVEESGGFAPCNAVVVIDVSGSMGWEIDPVTGETVSQSSGSPNRLELAKEALINLANDFATKGVPVNFSIIPFSSGDGATGGALPAETFDLSTPGGLSAALSYIDSLEVGFGPLGTGTEYDDALIVTRDLLESQLVDPDLSGFGHKVYFLSDGMPNNNEEAPADWQGFVDANDIDVIPVGIGEFDTSGLTPVGNAGDPILQVLNPFDLNAVLLSTTQNSVSGNVLANDEFGADGPGDIPVQSFSHNGFEYTEATSFGANPDIISVNGSSIIILTELGGTFEFDFATGDYTYTAASGTGGLDERFDYVLVDNDGDTFETYLEVCITEDEEPIIGAPAEVSVDEAALSIGSTPLSTAEVVSDVLDYDFGPDGQALVNPFSWSSIVTVTDTDDLGPINLTSNGEQVIFEVVDGGETLIGKTVGGDDVIRITLDDINTGAFTTELLGQVDHPDLDEVGLADQLTLNLSYTIHDGDGSSAIGAVNVNILDDGPKALDDKVYVDEGIVQPCNLYYVIDVSGSMGWKIDPVTGQTVSQNSGSPNRLELTREALINLTLEYSSSNVPVLLTVIPFSSGDGATGGALAPEVFDISTLAGLSDALNYIDGLEVGEGSLGTGTEYDDALIVTRASLEDDLVNLPDYQHKVYFLSDGMPNDNQEAPADWQNFVDSNGIDVIPVGIGDFDISGLEPVGNSNDDILQVLNPFDLSAELLSTVYGSVTGNVLDNDMFGADGSPMDIASTAVNIISFMHDGNEYNPNSLESDPNVISNDGEVIKILTELGGRFELNFKTGEFTYNSIAVDSDQTESFEYTIQDSEGDLATATLDVCVQDVQSSINLLNLGIEPLDLTQLENIDQLDLNDGQQNLISLDVNDVLSITDGDNTLQIIGDENQDIVELTGGGWVDGGTVEHQGVVFDVYQQAGATVEIQQDLNQVIS